MTATPIVPPVSVSLDLDAANVLTMTVLGPAVPEPPDPVDPVPAPDVSWPPSPITDLEASPSVDKLQAAIDSCPSGGSVRIAAGPIDFLGRTVRLKTRTCVHANGLVTVNNAPGAGTNGAFDGEGITSWAITGKEPGQGFMFNGSLINATGAQKYLIANAIFNDAAGNGYDGSAIRIQNSSFALIVNNDFINCDGNVVGMYHMSNCTFDGNHFSDCFQPFSIQQATTADNTKGIDLWWFRNVFTGCGRAAIEVGPCYPGAEYFLNLRVENNWFADFEPTDEPEALLPISLVGQAAEQSTVKNNFMDRGLGAASGTANPGIEFTGSGICSDNIILNFAWAGFMYKSGWEITRNVYWVAPGQPKYSERPDGWSNNGDGTGNVHGNILPSSEPERPPPPERLATSAYYPKALRQRYALRT